MCIRDRRKGAKQLDLSTDASKRFERDTDINMIIKSLDALTGLICEIAGGEPSKNVVDIYPKVKEKNIIDFDIDNCNALLGTSLNKKDMINILNKLSLEVLEERKSIKCTIPSYRNDLERSVDLYEEIARVYGYDNIPIAEFFSGSYSSLKKDKNLLSKKISNMLSNSGFNEHFSNSLLSEKEMMLFDDSKNVEIANPLSSDMQFLRNSIIPGLIKAVEFNLNHADPSLQDSSHPLAPQFPSMHWGWAAGYRFAALEGMIDKNQDSVMETVFQYHPVDDSYYSDTITCDGIIENQNNVTIFINANYNKLIENIGTDEGGVYHGIHLSLIHI